MDPASFAATMLARQLATVFHSSFQSFLIQLYNQLPMYVFNGLWGGRGEREPVLLFYGQLFPPFKAVFIHRNLHELLCSEHRCTLCIISKTQATSQQPCKANIPARVCNLVATLAINNLDVLQLNCHSHALNVKMVPQCKQFTLRCHNPASKLNTMQMNE